MIKPLTLTILTAATISGCATNTRTIDEIVDPFDGPSPTIHIPANVATKEYDGSKGKFPPGRTINYQGHGVEYTTGITTNGAPGNPGAYTQIVVAAGAPTLHYYCTAHSGMGGQANTPT